MRSIARFGRDRCRLAVFLQHVWPGVPCIYYGDEIGLEGGGDPENRRAMDWNEANWDQGLRDWHRRLVGLRRDDQRLASGGVMVLHAAGDVFCFARILGGGALLAAVNRGPGEVTVELDVGVLGWTEGEAVDLLADGGAAVSAGALSLRLAPVSARLLDHEGVT